MSTSSPGGSGPGQGELLSPISFSRRAWGCGKGSEGGLQCGHVWLEKLRFAIIYKMEEMPHGVEVRINHEYKALSKWQ